MNEDRRRFQRCPIVSRYNINTYSFIIENNRYRSQPKYGEDLSDVHPGAEYTITACGVAG